MRSRYSIQSHITYVRDLSRPVADPLVATHGLLFQRQSDMKQMQTDGPWLKPEDWVQVGETGRGAARGHRIFSSKADQFTGGVR